MRQASISSAGRPSPGARRTNPQDRAGAGSGRDDAAAAVGQQHSIPRLIETLFEQAQAALAAHGPVGAGISGTHVWGDQVEQGAVALVEVAAGPLQGGAGDLVRGAADLHGDLPRQPQAFAVTVVVHVAATPLLIAEEVGDLHRPRREAAEMVDDDGLLVPEPSEGFAGLGVEEAGWIVGRDERGRF